MRVLILLVLSLWAVPASAYVQKISKTGYPFHWATEQVTWHVNMGCPENAPCWNDLVKQAVDEWNAVNAPFHIDLIVGDPDAPVSCAEDDDWNTIRWAVDQCNGGEFTALGVTWYSYVGWTGQINEIDIRFKQDWPWTTQEFYEVALHELGHALGLGHPNEHGQEVRSVMNKNGTGLHESGVIHDHLQLDDRHGIRGIYGTLWWDDTDAPTEVLGAWELVHPESGESFSFTLTHLREYQNGWWARDWQEASIMLASRNFRLGTSWWTHYFLFRADANPTCLRMWLLYEGPMMFSGRLSAGHTKDENGRCTVYPSDRWYDVELYRD